MPTYFFKDDFTETPGLEHPDGWVPEVGTYDLGAVTYYKIAASGTYLRSDAVAFGGDTGGNFLLNPLEITSAKYVFETKFYWDGNAPLQAYASKVLISAYHSTNVNTWLNAVYDSDDNSWGIEVGNDSDFQFEYNLGAALVDDGEITLKLEVDEGTGVTTLYIDGVSIGSLPLVPDTRPDIGACQWQGDDFDAVIKDFYIDYFYIHDGEGEEAPTGEPHIGEVQGGLSIFPDLNFLPRPHTREPMAVFEDTEVDTGANRRYRFFTTAPEIQQVALQLNQDQFNTFYQWAEVDCKAWSFEFYVRLAGPEYDSGLEWWLARWVKPARWKYENGYGYYVTGEFRLLAGPYEVRPSIGELSVEAFAAVHADADLSTPKGLAAEATFALTVEAFLSDTGMELAAEALGSITVVADLSTGSQLEAEAEVSVTADAYLDIAEEFFRITSTGDYRVTSTGDSRVTYEAPAPASLEVAKFAAMQHDNSTWLSNSVRRQIVADYYGFVMCGVTTGLSGISGYFDALRAINPDIEISQYCQILEGKARGVYRIEPVSGTTYRVILDGTGEGAYTNDAYGANGNVAQLRNCTNSAFNGNWTMASVGTTGGRPSFQITGVAGSPGTETSSTGTVITTNDAHAERVLLIQENGGTKGWWLRNTSDRLISSGIAPAVRAVNYLETVTPSGGLYYPRIKADYDFAELFDPYQPTVGNPLIVWIDNWNYRPRTDSGVWGSTIGGPVSGGAIARTDATLQTRFREGLADYVARHRVNMPGVRVIGNADGSGTTSLNYAEWPTGTLDGAFVEKLYSGNSSGGEDTSTLGAQYNDAGATLQGRLREQRAELAEPGLHVVHARGIGASNAAQQADYVTFMGGLTATLMVGDTRANMSWYAFGPYLHDVTVDHVVHDEMLVGLGEPLEAEQTAARGWTGLASVWARYFEGGIAIWNSSTTTTATVTPSHLAGTSGSSLPGGADSLFDRINGSTNPFNTGTQVNSNFTIAPKTGVILVYRP